MVARPSEPRTRVLAVSTTERLWTAPTARAARRGGGRAGSAIRCAGGFSLDDLIRPQQHRLRNRQPQRLRGLSLMPAFAVFQSTAARASFGMACLKRSRRFALNAGARSDNPVMFPLGRARLPTRPDPTGSLTASMTTGMVFVACLTATAPGVLAATITSTLSATSAAANAG
jgi:hypothetical protein